ncbi:preprotein translocase subunit YajC [Porphyromonas pogonae]|uniref:preprotein translocase subunit YajC n=1 Tax=Porphyromonas pogonae TaxID=867595 RepID=UPI002E79AFD9|nr:preprotein translocase subunit YajC [Porphyromonas pogonae]
MNFMLLQAAAAQPNPNGGWYTILMIVAMFVIMWLFFIRPQQKRQKELQKKREAMKPGDRVVTSGGIIGVIKDVKANEFVVEIAENVKVRVDKGSVFLTASEAQEPAK